MGGVSNDCIVLPKDDSTQTDGACPTRARNFKVFTAVHGKEKPKKIILLEGHHEGAGGHMGANVENLINCDAFLVASAAIKVLEALMQAVQQKGLFSQRI